MRAPTPPEPAVPLALCCCLLVLFPGTALALGAPPADDTPDDLVRQLRAEADALAGELVTSDAGRAFLDAVGSLPPARERTVFVDREAGRYLAPAEAATLPDGARAALEERTLAATTYYLTRYGSPVAYARALDLLGGAGVAGWEGVRLLDFGYGGVGHLRALASAGAHVTGVDVDSFLTALYGSPGDTGEVARDDGPPGSVRLVEGRWPSEDGVVGSVGDGYDVFLSKNTLKRGYVHPARPVDPRMTIDLGVDDATFLAHLRRVLRPGGLAMIYNICPPEAADDEPYVPWADGRSPFPREAWEAAGFEVLEIDRVDDDATRRMGLALGWGDEAELAEGYFAWFTLARRLPDAARDSETR